MKLIDTSRLAAGTSSFSTTAEITVKGTITAIGDKVTIKVLLVDDKPVASFLEELDLVARVASKSIGKDVANKFTTDEWVLKAKPFITSLGDGILNCNVGIYSNDFGLGTFITIKSLIK